MLFNSLTSYEKDPLTKLQAAVSDVCFTMFGGEV